jgi:hypothetical protein
MKELITNERLEAFTMVAPFDELPARVFGRHGDLADWFRFNVQYPVEDVQWREMLEGFRPG